MIENPAKYYAGVAYHYWRCGLTSVEVGQELGIKPPHVRCILWRMGKVAGQLGYAPVKSIKKGLRGSAATAKRKSLPTTDELLAVAKAVIEKHRHEQISASLRGRKRPPMTQAQKDKLSAAHKGRSLSAKHRQHISEAQQGHPVSEATRKKIGDGNRAAALAGRAHQSSMLIPITERLPLVVKMYSQGAKPGAIAAALGWGVNAHGGQDGYGMVKKLAVQAGLR